MRSIGLSNECLQVEHDDFLEDPALFYDELPQPYRRINKILLEIFNDAWEEIAKWEAARIKDASRIRPPIYDRAFQLQGFSEASCLTCSPDGLHVAVGLSNGLAVVSGPSQQMEAIWTEDGVHITQLDLKQMSKDVLVINAHDEQGVVRLYAYTKEMLFLLYIFSEGEESIQKTAVKSDICLSVDFIGIFVQGSSQQMGCLDVYRLPKETWLKEIETTVGKIIADKQNSLKAEGEMLEEVISPASTEEINETTCALVEGATKLPDASHQRIFATQKFSSPMLVLKLQHPSKVPSMSWSSPYQASRVAGSDGDIIGTGSNHIVSALHLSNRMAMFKHQHEQYLRYLPKDYTSTSSSSAEQVLPTFHFLLPGKLSPQEQLSTGQPNSIAVWWTGERHLLQFSLSKSSKDSKPDSVWSLSSSVVSSAVSECSCTMALALSNNSIVLWNRFLGLPFKTLNLDDAGQISWMTFTARSSNADITDLGSGINGASCLDLLVQCTSGAVYTVSCSWGKDPVPVLVSTEICNADEIPAGIEPIRGIAQLILLARRDGRMFLHNINQKALLCEVTLPKCYALYEALEQPAVVTANAGRMLYAIGTRTATEEESEDTDTSAHRSLFAVKLWLFPHLDSYQQPVANTQSAYQPCCQKGSQNNLEMHTSKILQNRIDDQLSRRTHLQSRWYKMKEELSHSLQLMAGQ